MAQVTQPIILDSTGQAIASALETLASFPHIVTGENALIDDQTPLPDGVLYIQVDASSV